MKLKPAKPAKKSGSANKNSNSTRKCGGKRGGLSAEKLREPKGRMDALNELDVKVRLPQNVEEPGSEPEGEGEQDQEEKKERKVDVGVEQVVDGALLKAQQNNFNAAKITKKSKLKTIFLGNYLLEQFKKLKKDPTRAEDMEELVEKNNSTLPEPRKVILRSMLPKAKRMHKALLCNAADRGLGCAWRIAYAASRDGVAIPDAVNQKWPYLYIVPVEETQSQTADRRSSFGVAPQLRCWQHRRTSYNIFLTTGKKATNSPTVKDDPQATPPGRALAATDGQKAWASPQPSAGEAAAPGVKNDAKQDSSSDKGVSTTGGGSTSCSNSNLNSSAENSPKDGTDAKGAEPEVKGVLQKDVHGHDQEKESGGAAAVEEGRFDLSEHKVWENINGMQLEDVSGQQPRRRCHASSFKFSSKASSMDGRVDDEKIMREAAQDRAAAADGNMLSSVRADKKKTSDGHDDNLEMHHKNNVGVRLAAENAKHKQAMEAAKKEAIKMSPLTALLFEDIETKEIMNRAVSTGCDPNTGIPLLVFPFGFCMEKLSAEYLTRSLICHAVEDSANETSFEPTDVRLQVLMENSDQFLHVLQRVSRGESVKALLETERNTGTLNIEEDARTRIKKAYKEHDAKHEEKLKDGKDWHEDLKALHTFAGFAKVYKKYVAPVIKLFESLPAPLDVSVLKLVVCSLRLYRREFQAEVGSAIETIDNTLSGYSEDWLRPFLAITEHYAQVKKKINNGDIIVTNKESPGKSAARLFPKNHYDMLDTLGKIGKPKLLEQKCEIIIPVPPIKPGEDAVKHSLKEATKVVSRPPLSLMIEAAILLGNAQKCLIDNLKSCTSVETFSLPPQWTTMTNNMNLLISRNPQTSKPVQILLNEAKATAKAVFELVVTKEDEEKTHRLIDEAVTANDRAAVVDNNFMSNIMRLHAGYKQTLMSYAGGTAGGRGMEDVVSDPEDESEEEEMTDDDSDFDEDLDIHAPKRVRTDY
mmetsp:Transcript_8893/g.21684  ORF Transcript_8893/g.21684 Transcript_8893/m.21684 type:complete len:981 (-) Transcript_8893:864-3806(-)